MRTDVAGPTRLELATSGVTGRRSNQLNYDPALGVRFIIGKQGASFNRNRRSEAPPEPLTLGK